MKILVTGGCGFIGSNFIKKALDSGAEILNVDALKYSGNLSNLKDVLENKKLKFVKLDICDKNALRKVVFEFHPNYIIHFAAESHVDRSIRAAEPFIQSNIVGTFSLLEITREFYDVAKYDFIRFHHVSTDEVYGSLKLDDGTKFSEISQYAPNSPYAASKAASDHLVRAWTNTYGIPSVITHCSNNYGPFQFPEKLIPLTIINARRKNPIQIYGDGKNVRDWLHVFDHCDALLQIIGRKDVPPNINIGGNQEVSNLTMVNILCEVLATQLKLDPQNIKSLIQFVDDRRGHDMRYAIDTKLLNSEIGWTPRIGLDLGLQQTVHWYIANQDWWEPILSK